MNDDESASGPGTPARTPHAPGERDTGEVAAGAGLRDPVSPPPVLRDPSFALLAVLVTVGFVLVLAPFFGAVFWATVLAILFTPLYRRLARAFRQRRSLASAATVLIILLMVILPAALVAAMLVQEAASLYARIQAGEVSVNRVIQQIINALPAWAVNWLDDVGLPSLSQFQERLTAALVKSAQFLGAQALNIGQHTLDFFVSVFIMLYVLFFLLRDGAETTRRIAAAIPLRDDLVRELGQRFARAIRATVKGNIVVALVQGFLGGVIFALLGVRAPVLWAVVMAIVSLLPAVGTALVWLPVAIYFLATGAIWQGVLLAAYGVLVIGLVDNLLRPILVGKDTRIPDYIVLLTTLGGLALFGLNGFVIGPVIAAMFLAVWDIAATSKASAAAHGFPKADRRPQPKAP